MLSDPFVACLMLTRDRPEMARRAFECFLAQSYPAERRTLVTLDTSATHWRSVPFGMMRNMGVDLAVKTDFHPPDVIIHWDDDDWHGPDRIRLQVGHLIGAGGAAVGLSSGLFYERITGDCYEYRSTEKNYVFGASLCYWVDSWKRTPFPQRNNADEFWAETVGRQGFMWEEYDPEPLMICEVHGANHGTRIQPGKEEWTRRPEWDEFCRSKLVLQSAHAAPPASL